MQFSIRLLYSCTYLLAFGPSTKPESWISVSPLTESASATRCSAFWVLPWSRSPPPCTGESRWPSVDRLCWLRLFGSSVYTSSTYVDVRSCRSPHVPVRSPPPDTQQSQPFISTAAAVLTILRSPRVFGHVFAVALLDVCAEGVSTHPKTDCTRESGTP